MGFLDDFRKGQEKARAADSGNSTKEPRKKGWFRSLSTGKQIGVVAGGLIALMILISIGSADEENGGPPSQAQTERIDAKVLAVEPKDSGVEGVPVPSQAIEVETVDDRAWEAPASWTYADLKGWYSSRMPVGSDFGAWKWCETAGSASWNQTRTYFKSGKEILAVTLVNSQKPDENPAVFVGTDQSGPCKQSAAAPEQPTPGQENALQVAEDYLSIQAFSKEGLIQQLSSSFGEGFSKADAIYAANNVDVDWNEQAVKAARDYLDLQPMSESALVDQLSSSAGEGFTLEQARYGARKAYSEG